MFVLSIQVFEHNLGKISGAWLEGSKLCGILNQKIHELHHIYVHLLKSIVYIYLIYT